MLKGKELEMYNAQNKNIRVIYKNDDVLEGYCSEFSAACDNDPEDASITLNKPIDKKTGRILPWLTEIMESEIKKIEILG